jgi:hypothetical protein
MARAVADNVIGRYWFDGEGKRIKKETATGTTVFVYSGSKLIAKYENHPAEAALRFRTDGSLPSFKLCRFVGLVGRGRIPRSGRSEMFVDTVQYNRARSSGAAWGFRSAGARYLFGGLGYKHVAPTGAKGS